jgi:hypothetical protein
MPALLLGLVALVLALWALNVISKVDPSVGARVAKIAGGLLSIGLAVFLGVRGQLGIAIPVGIFGLGLLGWMPFGLPGSGRAKKSGGQTSRVRSRYLEMVLDHDSGRMSGRVLAGRQQGAALEQLDVKSLVGLLAEVDDESRALLMAYLDRRDSRWRQHAHADADTGGGAAASSGKMSEQEAYQILGLEPGAGPDLITRAHRTLMKKFHPDQGGTSYLAARINEAKEILLRRHR